MKKASLSVGVVALCVPFSLAWADDVPGSKDPAGFKRFEGSEIIHYITRSYDQYFMARADSDFDQNERIEGALTRIVYLVPDGHTSLEVFRNYEQMLIDAGFTQTFEMASGALKSNEFPDRFYFQSQFAARKDHEGEPFRGAANPYYVTMQANKDGHEVNVAVYVAETTWDSWTETGVEKPYVIKPGQAVVGLDVVTSKAMSMSMVEVKASDIATALASKGSFDLYGIYFDVDKADIKPASSKTLEQVALLLKNDPSLKLEIAGHTDNTGSPDHNMALSQARAQAVVDELVKNYGIDAGRLEAKGYGDTKPVATNDTDVGRAKNRRVELKKI